MQCAMCQEKPAVVHLTQVMGEKVQKVDLCAKCAEANGLIDCDMGSERGSVSSMTPGPPPANMVAIMNKFGKFQKNPGMDGGQPSAN
jgi:sulfur relay (sulfurtransferase) complex TusBCD TusD component (DsrE family)